MRQEVGPRCIIEVEYEGEVVERGERVAYAGEEGWVRGWYGEGESVAGG